MGSPPLLCVLRFYASAQLFMQSFRVVSKYEKRSCGQTLRGATVSRLFIRFSCLCFVGRSGTSPDLEFRAFHTDGTRCRLFRAYFLSSNFIEPFCLCERTPPRSSVMDIMTTTAIFTQTASGRYLVFFLFNKSGTRSVVEVSAVALHLSRPRPQVS